MFQPGIQSPKIESFLQLNSKHPQINGHQRHHLKLNKMPNFVLEGLTPEVM